MEELPFDLDIRHVAINAACATAVDAQVTLDTNEIAASPPAGDGDGATVAIITLVS